MARVTAVTAIRAWVNAHPTLAGPGRPLALGTFRARPRSPGQGAYLTLHRLDGADALIAEEAVDQARIAGVVYAGTEEAAETAATAYANALAALSGAHTAMGDAVCLVVDDITGPQFIDDRAGDSELFAFSVDADFYLINGGS
ncbi:hypothetical protein [Nonomuraea rhodomycinica]|uniref:Uncharacterized protein n=1 Tax=Nonomuraea rhodomycinica TaxID=1712872 RepID=A0A7Y6MFZ5_9ACTN|nr:hypothetical protein [Nonomuraea rhodomycinica]NUW45545.1 hypothetical protein [Nonomuraea rhodomycinica]